MTATYTPPSGGAINFGLTGTYDPYAGNAVYFNIGVSSAELSVIITEMTSISAALATAIQLTMTCSTVSQAQAHLGDDWEETIYIENFMTMIL